MSSSYINSILGIVPTVHIDFDRDKPWDPETPETLNEHIVSASVQIMQQTKWDLALVEAGSFVYLLRKSSQLFLSGEINFNDEIYSFWTPKRLQLVPMSYQMVDIPRL